MTLWLRYNWSDLESRHSQGLKFLENLAKIRVVFFLLKNKFQLKQNPVDEIYYEIPFGIVITHLLVSALKIWIYIKPLTQTLSLKLEDYRYYLSR